MQTLTRLLSFLVVLLLPVRAFSAEAPAGRERLLMDSGWRFALGHPSDPARDFNHATGYFSYLAKAGFGDGPAAEKFDDAAWRKLDLPHDWAVETPFAAQGSASHGNKSVGRNFPENSLGWYRKTFTLPASDLGRRISVEFDGVYRDSVVFVNGFYLGRQPSGYTSFSYDLTDYLNYGGENVISVRVDAMMEEGWFYEGAGIYRHVWLTKTAPLHVAQWGTAVTTAVNDNSASVTARTMVINAGTGVAVYDLEQSVVDPAGKVVASGKTVGVSLAAGGSEESTVVLAVAAPQLWSIEMPAMHRLVTTVRAGGATVDQYVTNFGIRTIRFDPDQGFFINGKHVKLKGTNNHQDHAGVGVALPDALQDFRIARLKEMGSNAYRCSHNPPTPELLDACDRLGLLVIDENRLMGPSPEQLNQLEAMIRRDRNHPSVIMWSVGNEEWGIESNSKGARMAASMQAFAQRLDPTRRITAAISGGWGGISSTIEAAGVNYIKQAKPDQQHADYPKQIILGTEETTTQQTRGIYFDDRAQAHLSPQPDGSSGGNAEGGWQYYVARPYLAGLFYWTGFDYRGEPTPFGWPAVGSQFGILDTCGFPKDGFYYLKAWWTDAPVLHVFPHWNWPGREGQEITVSANSNHESVELFLNGKSLGKKDMPVNGHLEWKVVYQPGVLEARGYRGGKVVETTRVETTGAPASLVLTPDRTSINADGRDVAVFTVAVRDAQGRAVSTADTLVKFEVSGGRVIGVGNGDPSSHEPEQFNPDLALVSVSDWRGRLAPVGTQISASPDSLDPLPRLGHWQAVLPKAGEVYDLSGTFVLSAVPSGVVLELFLPSFGSKTTFWLNGRELARDVDTAAAGLAIKLDPAQLSAGLNRVQMIVTPVLDHRNHIPEQIAKLGSLRITTSAPPAQRHLFNGLAQVIVQSTQDAGTIRLTAKSDGLAPAESVVNKNSVPQRASVP